MLVAVKIEQKAFLVGLILWALCFCACSDTLAPGDPQDRFGPRLPAMVEIACKGGQKWSGRAGQGARLVLARQVADSWMIRHPAAELGWDWGPSVLAQGMLDLYEVTGDIRYHDYVRDWLLSWQGRYAMLWSDTVAPAGVAARLSAYECDTRLWIMVQDAMHYLLEEAPRTPQGGISHLGTFLPGTPQLWVDSLFMFGSFLMGWSDATGDDRGVRLLQDQMEIFAVLLQDRGGLFRHAWLPEGPYPAEAAFWGRGNGWVAVAAVELFRRLNDRPDLAAVEKHLLEGALATQDSGGLWWTVMNRAGLGYLEVSGSALLAVGMRRAAASGLLSGVTYEQGYSAALSAVVAAIRVDNGVATVTGISTATQPSTAEWYAAVPVDDDVHYGVGAVLMLLSGR